MKDKGTILKAVKGDNIEVLIDANFAGNWDPKEYTNRATAISRHIYLIKYGGCPILCK